MIRQFLLLGLGMWIVGASAQTPAPGNSSSPTNAQPSPAGKPAKTPPANKVKQPAHKPAAVAPHVYGGAQGSKPDPSTACSTARLKPDGTLDCGMSGSGATPKPQPP